VTTVSTKAVTIRKTIYHKECFYLQTFSQSKATTSGCSAGRNNETMKSLTMNNSCNGEMLVRTVSNSSRTEIRNYSPSLVEQDVHRGTGQIHSVEGV